MTDRSQEAWREVDRRFSEFGRIVAERYREAGKGSTGPEMDEAKRKVEEAFSALTRQLDQTFTSVGETIRDQQARDTLKDAGKAVVEAVSSTFGEIGEEIRKRRPGSGGSSST